MEPWCTGAGPMSVSPSVSPAILGGKHALWLPIAEESLLSPPDAVHPGYWAPGWCSAHLMLSPSMLVWFLNFPEVGLTDEVRSIGDPLQGPLPYLFHSTRWTLHSHAMVPSHPQANWEKSPKKNWRECPSHYVKCLRYFIAGERKLRYWNKHKPTDYL